MYSGLEKIIELYVSLKFFLLGLDYLNVVQNKGEKKKKREVKLQIWVLNEYRWLSRTIEVLAVFFNFHFNSWQPPFG